MMSRRTLAAAVVVIGVLGGASWPWARRNAATTRGAAVPRGARAASASRVDAPRDLRPTPRPAVPQRAEGQLAAETLAAFDAALGDGYQRCAPELEGFAPAVLRELEHDWRSLKPDLRPSWDAWGAIHGMVLDEERMQRCRQTFARGDCAEVAALWDECRLPYSGTLELGDACLLEGQCVSGACRFGRCAPPDECTGDFGCGAGMLCIPGELGNATCVPAPLEGEECAANRACAEALWCDEQLRCRAISRGATGEVCHSPSVGCADGNWCMQGHCVDLSSLKDALRPSPDDNAAPIPCSCRNSRDEMACIDGDDGPACVPVRYADLGESCDDNAVLCRGALRATYCRDGTCVRDRSIGEPCGPDEQCGIGLGCANGVCAKPAAAGEPCDDDDACAYGLWCTLEEGDAEAGANGAAICDLPRTR